MKIGDLISILSITSALPGLAFVLMAFGEIPVSKNPEANRLWIKKYGVFVGITGAVMFGTGVYYAVQLF